MIVVFTAVHGAFETAQHTIAAIDRSCPAPYMHLIGDDFSPEPDHSHYMSLPSIPHPQCLRAVYECSELGSDGGPSMGLSLGYVWSFARVLRAEALWVVESDVVPQQDIVAFFRQAPEFYGDGPIGAIAPLYTGGGSALTTYGGKDLVEVQDFPERLGIAPGDNIVKSDTLAHTLRRRIVAELYPWSGFLPYCEVQELISVHERMEREGGPAAAGYGEAWFWSIVYGGANFSLQVGGIAPGNCAGPMDVKHSPRVLDPVQNIEWHCREMLGFWKRGVRGRDLCEHVFLPANPRDWGGGRFRRTEARCRKALEETQ